jgi:hypothetical protein
VSFTASLFQTSANVPVMPVIRGIIGLSAFIAVAMFFKPLLTGIARALVLIVRPPLSKQERVARRQLRDARLMQRMINSSQGPSHAAELRAMMARA